MKHRHNSFVIIDVIFVIFVNIVIILSTKSNTVTGETFTLGYLTGSQRKFGDMEYERPGTFTSLY